jgi:ABC-type multidrug transport system fused ATPase/permease subunit
MNASGVVPSEVVSAVGGLYRNVWRYAAGARPQLLLSATLLVSSQLVKLGIPWLAAQAINTLQRAGAHAVRHAAWYIAAIILTYAAAWAMHGPGRILERAVGLRIRQGYSDALYAKLMRLPMAWHDRHHSADVQQRVGQATAALYGFAQNQFVYLQTTVNLVGPVVALTLFSRNLGLMALTGYLVVAFVILRFDRALMGLATLENAAERKYQAGLLDFLGNVSTLLSLRLQATTQRLLWERMKACFVPLKRSILLGEAKWCAVDLMSASLTWALVAAFVWLRGRHGATLMVGSVFMVYQYAQQAGGVVSSIAGNFQGFARTRTDFASAELLWSASDQPDAGPALPVTWKQIALRDICYDHATAPVVKDPDPGSTLDEAAALMPSGLHNVGFTLLRGDRVALVGSSGSGKSTLMRVLAGLYAPRRQHIEVDGVYRADIKHLGSISTLIPQEADVFEATVRENIAFGGAYTDNEVASALSASAFGEVMADMSMRLDTPIAERGYNLSGGQRQRLCLARGVLAARRSSLVMLDEPTSALDPVTEEMVFTRLTAAFATSCLVVSVHRLSLLHHFSKVVLMADGRVLDVGSVAELLERQQAFRKMMNCAPLSGAEPPAALRLVGH